MITPEHITVPITSKRLLFSTNTFIATLPWQCDFAHFSPEAITYLAKHDVVLIGIDTPSVDAFNSKSLSAHKLLAIYDIAMLEGIDLSAVPCGDYELIALPLKLVGADASPVRAILRQRT
jgi:arylformamidase